MDFHPCSYGLEQSDFQLFEPLKKHLAGKQFATDDQVKQAVTSWLQIYTIFLPLRDTSLCATVRQMLNCLLPMCYSHIEGGIKFLAQECVLSCFLKLLYMYIQL